MNRKRIAVLPGDGIGPEVVEEAVLLLQEVATKYQVELELVQGKIGGHAIDEDGTPLPEATVELCQSSDAVLLGAVGGPKWDRNPAHLRPEAGLLGIRKALDLYANLRPVTVFPVLRDASTLKPEVLEGVDMLIVRELTGGLYFGTPRERREGPDGLEVVDTLHYKQSEIERIVRLGFELARTRRKQLCSVDKANVLESSRVWRETADRLASEYPDVELTHMLVDNAAMQLVRNPRQFDVMVTENMFGDILSDEASMVAGSIGMMSSGSLGADGSRGLYEPVHGSAPDIAGQDKANPLATFLSVAMMLRTSLDLPQAADDIEQAVASVLDAGARTGDLARAGDVVIGTREMGKRVRNALVGGAVHGGQVTV